MNCENCVNLLDDLFDGELREQLAAQVGSTYYRLRRLRVRVCDD